MCMTTVLDALIGMPTAVPPFRAKKAGIASLSPLQSSLQSKLPLPGRVRTKSRAQGVWPRALPGRWSSLVKTSSAQAARCAAKSASHIARASCRLWCTWVPVTDRLLPCPAGHCSERVASGCSGCRLPKQRLPRQERSLSFSIARPCTMHQDRSTLTRWAQLVWSRAAANYAQSVLKCMKIA